MRRIFHFTNPYTQLYREAGLSKEISRSLNNILVGAVIGTVFSLICSSGTTAVVSLINYIGGNDLTYGIITTVLQCATLIQLPFALLVSRGKRRKLFVQLFGFPARIIWLFAGLIPIFIPASDVALRVFSLIFIIGISAVGNNIVTVCWFPWFSDLAPESIRGRYLSIREQINAIVQIVAGLIVSLLLDNLPEPTRYIIIFALGAAVGVTDLCFLCSAKVVYATQPQRKPIFSVFKDIVKNKPFVRYSVFWTLWCFTANFCGVYITPYSMNVMGLSATQIMLFATFVSLGVTILVSPKWGKAIFYHGSRSVMLVAGTLVPLIQLVYLFSSPGNIWPTLLNNLFGALFWVGANLTNTNLLVGYSSGENGATYVAVYTCLVSLPGTALGSLCGGYFLNTCVEYGWFSAGFPDRYQVLILIGTVLRLLIVLLFVPGLNNENAGTPKSLIRHILHPEGFRLFRKRR